jgi:hypothetical protein
MSESKTMTENYETVERSHDVVIVVARGSNPARRPAIAASGWASSGGARALSISEGQPIGDTFVQ